MLSKSLDTSTIAPATGFPVVLSTTTPLMLPGAKCTIALLVTGTSNPSTLAPTVTVNMSSPETFEDCRVNNAFPFASVITVFPFLRVPLVTFIVTVFPGTGLLFSSNTCTVRVVASSPSPTIELGEAVTVTLYLDT
ncbi:hypothetical protein D3C76_536700 [compost metagenome]